MRPRARHDPSAALTRYYISTPAPAASRRRHTTQFAIASRIVQAGAGIGRGDGSAWTGGRWHWSPGWSGPTRQAIAEAEIARRHRLSCRAAQSRRDEIRLPKDEIIAHCEAVAREIPLVGFYLQPAVGGVV